MKIAWLSRHAMTDEQRLDAARWLVDRGDESQVEIERINLTWTASDDYGADLLANREIWESLLGYDAVCGVLPPVALEALASDWNKPILIPVSRQVPELRKGDGHIPFVHLRMCNVQEWK